MNAVKSFKELKVLSNSANKGPHFVFTIKKDPIEDNEDEKIPNELNDRIANMRAKTSEPIEQLSQIQFYYPSHSI